MQYLNDNQKIFSFYTFKVGSDKFIHIQFTFNQIEILR